MPSGQVGFVGLGRMGLPMVRRLAERFRVLAYDVSPIPSGLINVEKCESIIDLGKCDTIFVMLPDQVAVKQALVEGELGRGMKEGTTILDCSTVAPEFSVATSSHFMKRQIQYIDSPISGGIKSAQAGSLSFMLGCDKAESQRLRHFLEPMGPRMFPLERRGRGSWAKLLNNYLLARNMRDLCRVYSCSQQGPGLGASLLHELLVASSGNCWSNEKYCPVPGIIQGAPSSLEYATGFTLKLMLKDLRLFSSSAASSSAGLRLEIEDVINEYEQAAKVFGDDKDFSILYQLYKQS